jgi:hypothetical protein
VLILSRSRTIGNGKKRLMLRRRKGLLDKARLLLHYHSLCWSGNLSCNLCWRSTYRPPEEEAENSLDTKEKQRNSNKTPIAMQIVPSNSTGTRVQTRDQLPRLPEQLWKETQSI